VITHNLFPTSVSFFELGREFSAKENKFLLNLEQKPNEGNTTSKERHLLDNTKLASLREFIDASVASYFKEIYSPKNEVSLRITQSWVNYTKPGQWHHKHAHPNSLISGVFYIKANKETDRIHFFKDGYQQIKLPVDQFNLYNSESWWLPVGTGELILFPSSFTHMVEAVKGEDLRVSMSFNTFPVGYVGDDDSLDRLAPVGLDTWPILLN
jgi:uncharacterized protein (TIGR02466 family)